MKPTISLTRILSSFSYGERIQPFRDWAVLISVGMCLLLVSAAWNTWLFYRVVNGETLAPGAPVSEPGPSLEALTKAEALFDTRSAEEARYRTEYQFIDPSL